MKKLIVSLLFIGSCLFTKAQSNACNVDYFHKLGLDTLSQSGNLWEPFAVRLNDYYQLGGIEIIGLNESNWTFELIGINENGVIVKYYTMCEAEGRFGH
jgi:hypothetical protein